MRKPECEKAIRHLCHEWRKAEGYQGTPADQLSFGSFHSWLRNNYPQHLKFRSVMPVADEVERWFDQEFGQTWRN